MRENPGREGAQVVFPSPPGRRVKGRSPPPTATLPWQGRELGRRLLQSAFISPLCVICVKKVDFGIHAPQRSQTPHSRGELDLRVCGNDGAGCCAVGTYSPSKTGGSRSNRRLFCSMAWASCSRPNSSRARPTICIPMGSPVLLKATGTDSAGCAVIVIR